jgi:hypothetical protein
MREQLTLPDEQVWQDDEHLTDLALTAIADGELGLLTAAARDHVDGCDHCTARLGDQALMTLSVHEALNHTPVVELVAAPVPVQAARPLPTAALLLGLLIAVLGALPALFQAPAWLGDLPATLTRVAPVTLRVAASLMKVASTSSASLVVLWTVAAVMLAVIGMIVARLAPREAAWKGVSK